jgi:hypothetical protein
MRPAEIAIAASDRTPPIAGTANKDMTVVSVIPALSPAPINIGAASVPIQPMLLVGPKVHTMPGHWKSRCGMTGLGTSRNA